MLSSVARKTLKKQAGAVIKRCASTAAGSSRQLALVAGVATAAAAAVYASSRPAKCNEDIVQPTPQPWQFEGPFTKIDTASIRRGYEVYRQVCSTCHSMDFMSFRNLVGVSHTTAQAKALAASYTVKDGPDEKGEFFERPAVLSDPFPKPYENEAVARFANNGAAPPDLSCVVKGRPDGSNYLYALLTGYKDTAPAGIKVREGTYFNPYFPGGLIGMPPPLQDGGLEYEDGTPATVSQMAKDVTTFLTWASEPETDDRKRFAFQALVPILAAAVFAGYYKRMKWSVIKNARHSWIDIKFSRASAGKSGGH